MRRNTREDFLNNIERIPFHPCWEWVGLKFNSGYGRFYEMGITYPAHRYSFMLYKGLIPEGKVIMHSCDNKGCVNPAHLTVGTCLDNTRDMINKGRKFLTLGETNGQSKLTSEDVFEIRRQAVNGAILCRLAKQYKVSTGLITMIVKRRVWRHI